MALTTFQSGQNFELLDPAALDTIMSMHDIFGNNKISKDEFYTIFDNDDDFNIAKMIKKEVSKILKAKVNIELSEQDRRQKVS